MTASSRGLDSCWMTSPTRIEVEEETMSVDVEYFGEIDLDEPTEESLLD